MTSTMINILSLSDIHLGNKRTTTEFIIDNLNKYVSNDEVLSNINILILAGDVFDTQLTLSNPDIHIIDLWISKLLRLCRKYNVSIRVLEGTPSHDRLQSERFLTINNVHTNKADLHYATTLSIEYIEKYNIHVLYVPDEWRNTTEETLDEVKNLLRSNGIKTVDYAIMHGTFDYQLNDIKNIPKHSTVEYSELVKELIFVGHIHQHSSNGKVIAHGSFDRLGFGEESPKGCVLVNRIDSINKVSFIENKTAKRYITVESYDEDLVSLMKRLDKRTKKLASGSYIRIKTNITTNLAESIAELKNRYSDFIISIVKIDNVKKNVFITDNNDKYIPTIINNNNILNLVHDRLSKSNIDINTINNCIDTLKEVI